MRNQLLFEMKLFPNQTFFKFSLKKNFQKKFRDSNYPETMLNKLNMFRKTNQMIDLTIVVEVSDGNYPFLAQNIHKSSKNFLFSHFQRVLGLFWALKLVLYAINIPDKKLERYLWFIKVIYLWVFSTPNVILTIFQGREFYAHRLVMAAASESFLPSGKFQIFF